MRIRTFIVGTVVAISSLIPFATPAYATHNCGFEPCPHPDDVVWLLCKVPLVSKYAPFLCGV